MRQNQPQVSSRQPRIGEYKVHTHADDDRRHDHGGDQQHFDEAFARHGRVSQTQRRQSTQDYSKGGTRQSHRKAVEQCTQPL
ncbi:hypothetical protein D3C81_1128970 [compost metagenome]